MNDRDEYSVAVFADDDTYWFECHFVSAIEAAETFKRMIKNVGARSGMIKKVIITDGGDCTNVEWQFGKGITYPPDLQQLH